MEPKRVVQFNEWKIALVAAGGTTVLLLFVFCIWSSYYRRQLRQQMRRELLAELEWKDPQLLAMMESARAELRSCVSIAHEDTNKTIQVQSIVFHVCQARTMVLKELLCVLIARWDATAILLPTMKLYVHWQ